MKNKVIQNEKFHSLVRIYKLSCLILRKYFPQLKEKQLSRFEQLKPLYEEWNQKINVISRKDIDNLEYRHILHSLAIARVIGFKPDSRYICLCLSWCSLNGHADIGFSYGCFQTIGI